MRADDLRAAVLDHVREVVGRQPVVARHDDGADLRNGVVALEMRGRVRRDVGDAVALAHTERLQRRRPAVDPLAELLVREAAIAVDHGIAVRVQLAGAAQELESA